MQAQFTRGAFTKLYKADKPPKSRSFTFRVMGDKL